MGMILKLVDKDIFRGSQPKTSDDYDTLTKMKVIIKLNKEKLDTEKEFCKSYSIKLIYVPMSEWRAPFTSSLRSNAKMIRNVVQRWGTTFVHCEKGCDRTGYSIAAYRMLIDGWTYKKAFDEAVRLGHKWWWPPYWWWPKSLANLLRRG